jgi:hypothetical protein
MLKSLRVPEKLFGLVMWLVSLIFAMFLVGLGSKVIADLPRLDRALTLDQFADASALGAARLAIKSSNKALEALGDEREQALLAEQAATNAYASTRGAFDNWLATRKASNNPAQDAELLNRTRQLDALKARERLAQASLEDIGGRTLDTRQGLKRNVESEAAITKAAEGAYRSAQFKQEMRVFGVRLALTLPLLVLAGWLVMRRRHSEYWPLMRGFVVFAVFTFFFELVPYLPSYGGYVRYGVGIVLTLVAGHYVIRSMRAYLANRQRAEQQTQEQRRRALGYEAALKNLSANVCPGCDRALMSTGDASCNFCVHCGMTLFVNCPCCETRRNAFFHFCPTCGTTADNSVGVTPPVRADTDDSSAMVVVVMA